MPDHEPSKDQSYSEEESQTRFEAALKGALKTAPKPLKSMTRKRPNAQSEKGNKAKKKTAQTGI